MSHAADATPTPPAAPTAIPQPGPRVPATGRPAALAALQRALAAEHAAVWAYGVIGAHVEASSLSAVQRDLAAHRAWRDNLTTLITQLGGQPVAALPAYQLPTQVQSPAAARQLALLVEQRAGVVWADLVAAVPPVLRESGAAGLAGAAVRAAGWRGGPVPFPGLAHSPVPSGPPTTSASATPPSGSTTAPPASSGRAVQPSPAQPSSTS